MGPLYSRWCRWKLYCLLLELWVRARLGRGIRAEVLGHRCGRGELDIEFTGFWVQKECALGGRGCETEL